MSLRRVLPALLVFGVLVGGFALVRTCTAQEEDSPFGNVQVLTHVKSKSEMRGIMKEQAKALGVKCTYCHVQGKFDLDDKDEKVQARAMLRMASEINAQYFAEEEQGLTCWTCHRGADHPELTRPLEEGTPSAPAAPAGPTSTPPDAVSPFGNVKVLTQVTSKSEMRAIMKEQAKALGVKCTHCHVKGKFDLDDKDEKVQARAMLRMVSEINAKYFAEEEQGLTCWSCHRGAEHPEMTRPADAETAPEGFQAADPAQPARD